MKIIKYIIFFNTIFITMCKNHTTSSNLTKNHTTSSHKTKNHTGISHKTKNHTSHKTKNHTSNKKDHYTYTKIDTKTSIYNLVSTTSSQLTNSSNMSYSFSKYIVIFSIISSFLLF